ncbi:hypothetical protein ACM66B_000769 [Microbotryomycetes sp. NB124-2]
MRAEATASELLNKLQDSTWPESGEVLKLLQELELRRRWAIVELARLPLEHAHEPQRKRCRTTYATLAHPEATQRLCAIDLSWRKLAAEQALSSPSTSTADATAKLESVFTRSHWPFLELMNEENEHRVRFDAIGKRLKKRAQTPSATRKVYRPTEEDVLQVRALSIDWITTIMRALGTAEALLDQVANLSESSSPKLSNRYIPSSPPYISSSPEPEQAGSPELELPEQDEQTTPRAARPLKRKRSSNQNTPRAVEIEGPTSIAAVAFQMDLAAEEQGPGVYANSSSASTRDSSVEVEMVETMPAAAEAVADAFDEVDSFSQDSPPATQPAVHTMPLSVLQKLRGAAQANRDRLQAAMKRDVDSNKPFSVLEEPSEVTPAGPSSATSQGTVSNVLVSLGMVEGRQHSEVVAGVTVSEDADAADADEALPAGIEVPASSIDDAQRIISTSQTTVFPPAGQAVANDTTDTSGTSGTSQSQNSSGVLVPNTQSTGGDNSLPRIVTGVINTADSSALEAVAKEVGDESQTQASNGTSGSYSLEYLTKEETIRIERKMEEEEKQRAPAPVQTAPPAAQPEPITATVDNDQEADEILSQAVSMDDREDDFASAHSTPSKDAVSSIRFTTKPPTPGSPRVLSQPVDSGSPQFHTQAIDVPSLLDPSSGLRSFGELHQEADDSLSEIASVGPIDSE